MHSEDRRINQCRLSLRERTFSAERKTTIATVISEPILTVFCRGTGDSNSLRVYESLASNHPLQELSPHARAEGFAIRSKLGGDTPLDHIQSRSDLAVSQFVCMG